MSFLFTVCLTFISPAMALPFILYLCRTGRKSALVFWLVWLSLMSVYYIPYGDQYRYWLDFQEIEWFNDFFQESGAYRRVSIPFAIMYIVKRCNIHFEIVRVICVALSCGACLWAFSCLIDVRQDRIKQFAESRCRIAQCVIILFLSVPFLSICHGYRQGMGTCFGVSGIVCFLLLNKKTLGIILSVAAMLSHPTFLLIPVVLLLSSRISLINNHRFYVFFVLSLFGSCIFDAIFPYLSGFIPDTLQTYFAPDGEWRNVASGRNLIRNMAEMCMKGLVVIYGVLLWLRVNALTDRTIGSRLWFERIMSFANYCFWIFVIWCSFSSFYTLSMRLLYLILLLFSFLFIVLQISCESKLCFRNVFVLVGGIFLYICTNYRPMFVRLNYGDILCNSLVDTLTYSYDEKYITDNIGDDGLFLDDTWSLK